MKTYKTYIFDLDGTLLDTLGDLTSSVNHALRSVGLPERTQEDVRKFVGNGVRMLMKRAVPGGEDNVLFEDAFSEFRNYYLNHDKDQTVPYEGIMDMLTELKGRGAKIAVVSNKFLAATQSLCSHYFGNLVDVAIGEHEGVRKKPAPDTVEEALLRMGADKESAVYVGDSDVDILTAKNSGLPCISVLWGFRDKEFLEAHGATRFVVAPHNLVVS
jgi:phosphoglycolate phosphatase